MSASPPIHPSMSGDRAPTLAELRQQLEAAAQAYPQLRQGLGAALAEVRRVQGEAVPRRTDRRRGLR